MTTNMPRRRPLALVGRPVAGKGEAEKVFCEAGYRSIDTGRLIRMELRKLEGVRAPTREQQGAYAAWRRRTSGPGYFTDLGMRRLPGPYLVNGTRSRAEIDDLVARGFVIIAVITSDDLRFRLSQKRRSPRDPRTRFGFVEMDRRDCGYVLNGAGHWIGHGDPWLPAVDYVVRQAHVRLHNIGTKKDLRQAARECLLDLQDWSETQGWKLGPGKPVQNYGLSDESGQSSSQRSAA